MLRAFARGQADIAPLHVRRGRRIDPCEGEDLLAAFEQPPDYEVSEEDLNEFDPYITDVERADWFKDFQARQSTGSQERYEEDAIFMSAILGDLRHDI